MNTPAKTNTKTFVWLLLGGLMVWPISVLAKDFFRSPEEVVNALFKDHDPFTKQPFRGESDYARYCTKELSDLLIKDDECRIREKAACALTFNPIWGAQVIPDSLELKFVKMAVPNKPGSTRLIVSFADPEWTPVTFLMAQTSSGWKISDILYEKSGSLKALLSHEPQPD